MTDIVDVYRKHKDLLSVYFKSEEEAAECESRAKMGDDRAQRIISLAYDARVSTNKGIIYHRMKGGSFSSTREAIMIPFWEPIDKASRDDYHENAIDARNLEAINFSESVKLGNRSPLIKNPEWQPNLKSQSAYFLEEYCDDVMHDSGAAYAQNLEYSLKPKGSFHYEVCQNAAPHGLSSFNLIYNNNLPKWAADKRTTRSAIRQWSANYNNESALIVCAQAGSSEAARLLAALYKQVTFYEKETKVRLFGSNEYQYNSKHDSAKAKQWSDYAENLEGKTTPIECSKFLQDFIYSQDGTPDGLYNIGYALYHNKKIGNEARGIDYLKHAANLGNANAARELGEIFHTQFDERADRQNLGLAYFWYKTAAELGHPNGTARMAYLEKAYPELQQQKLNETLRNPSPAHIEKHPASAWRLEVKKLDLQDMIHNPQHGGILERMEGAVSAVDDNVREFEMATRILQAKIDDLAARQLVLDGHVETLKGEEITALRSNDALSAQQRTSQRALNNSKDRWVKETISNLGATMLLGVLGGVETSTVLGNMRSGTARATGYKNVAANEVDYHKALIAELEDRKIDTTKFPEQIKELALLVQQVADSKPMQQLMKDETRSRALVEGYLRQKILKSGLEVTRGLDDFARSNGLSSVDALLQAYEKEDIALYRAVSNLCYGHANSNDMAVLLHDVNQLSQHSGAPHERALKQYVELIVKSNIGQFMTCASQVDVIEDLKLVDFSTMEADGNKGTADLMQPLHMPSAETMGKQQVDAATKLALTTMFANQFGVTHIGQYDVKRMFNFYLHRHGRHELIASELQDGHVSDEQADKKVSLLDYKKMRGFVERTKQSAVEAREDQPNVGDLFLRTCGYEYFLPQAVITSGRGNRFKENPEAPVAYPMINSVIQSFIQRMSLSDINTYREKVGDELDNVLAQTFIDFFQDLGKSHAEQFKKERDHVRDGLTNNYYGSRYDLYSQKITNDAVEQYPRFLEIYEQNLKKHLQVMPEEEAKLLRQQIDSLEEDTKKYLAPNIPEIGSFQAKEESRANHKFENMSERWNRG